MALQLSVATRNARLDAIETITSTTPVLKFFSGAVTANCAAANPTGELDSYTLPSDWLDPAASGAIAKSAGAWSHAITTGGTIASFRLYKADGTTCIMQGTVTSTATGTGDMLVDNNVVTAAQVVTVNSFAITDGNA